MPRFRLRLAASLLCAGALALGLTFAACSQSSTTVTPTPVAPTTAVSQTLTITADGIFPSLAYIDANLPVKIVNNDSVSHLLHLDVEDQPGCSAFDLAGEIPPGESRVTGMITTEASGCDVHDHGHHNDKRFAVQLVVGEGG